jgi:hypothetical protein
MGVGVLQRLAPHVKENLGHWGHEGHKRKRNQAIALALGRKDRKHSSGRFIRGPALQLLGVPV